MLLVSLHSFVLRCLYLTLDHSVFLSFKSGDGLHTDLSPSDRGMGKMCYMCFDDIDRYVDIYADERYCLVLSLARVFTPSVLWLTVFFQ